MLVSAGAFVVMHATIRHVSAALHPFEIAFFRNVFGVIVLTPLLLRYGLAPLKARRPGLMAVRSVFNVCAMLCFFYALSIAPLADVSALSFTAPIFATALAALALGEVVRIRRWAAILVGFGGAMVIIRPGFAQLDFGLLLTLFSSFLWAIVIVMIKVLSRTDSSLTITLYMGLFMAPMALIPALGVWRWPTMEQYAWLLLIGGLGTVAQIAFAEALKHGETSIVMPFDFFKLILAALIGWFVFSEAPTLFTVAGGLIIFASATYIAVREAKIGLRR